MGACPYALTFFVVSRMPRCVTPVFIHAKWRRKPVETQDFASHEEVSAMCSCYNRRVVIAFVASPEEVSAIYPGYNQHVVIAFVACETQDFASLLNMSRFLYMHPLRLHSMKNRLTRRLPDIAVWNIPSHTFRINACDKLNNDNLTIPLYLFANDISGENTLVLSVL